MDAEHHQCVMLSRLYLYEQAPAASAFTSVFFVFLVVFGLWWIRYLSNRLLFVSHSGACGCCWHAARLLFACRGYGHVAAVVPQFISLDEQVSFHRDLPLFDLQRAVVAIDNLPLG